MTGQTKLDVDTGGLDHDAMRAAEADFTPEPVVRQMVEWMTYAYAGTPGGFWPASHLDPCAGAGVFSRVIRDFLPSCRTEAIEIREEEEEHLAWNAHEFAITDCLEALRKPAPFIKEQAPFEFCSTNPAFSLIPKIVPLLLSVTAEDGWVVLLGLNELGQRGSASRAVWREFPPLMQLRIAGTLKFRTGLNPNTGKPYTTDTRSYSWWCWKADGRGGCWALDGSWQCRDLPLLPARDRQWKVRPGTDHPDPGTGERRW